MTTDSKPATHEAIFTFRLPREQKLRLEHHAKKSGTSAAKLARHAVIALNSILDKQETQ